MLRIGTCSWKYDSWIGLVYTEKDPARYLEEYARRYSTVEVDQWFWSLFEKGVVLPKPDVARNYAESVPGDFVFSVKLPNSITLTHQKTGDGLRPNPHFLSTDLLSRFLKSIQPMEPLLGPIMLQFEYLNKQKMASQDAFLERLDEFMANCPPGYAYAVEVRNPNYLNRNLFEFFRKRRVIPVFLQGYYMPSVFPVIRTHMDLLETGAVIRLHGPDRKGIETKSGGEWNRILSPRDAEIGELSVLVPEMMNRKLDLFINVNNHYEGSAPLTIRKILNALPDSVQVKGGRDV